MAATSSSPAPFSKSRTTRLTPNPVAVIVQGESIGYLPGYAVDVAQISKVGPRAVPVQIFTEMLPMGLRAEAWAWLGNTAPQWEWSEADFPPMSPRDKAQAEHAGRRDLVMQRLADGGSRAVMIKAGVVNGVHFLELVEPIKQRSAKGSSRRL